LVLITYVHLEDGTSMDLRNIGKTTYTYTVPPISRSGVDL